MNVYIIYISTFTCDIICLEIQFASDTGYRDTCISSLLDVRRDDRSGIWHFDMVWGFSLWGARGGDQQQDSFGQLRTDSTNLKGLRVFQYIPLLRFFVLVVCATCRSWQLLDWNFLIRRECQRERIYANASQRMDPRVLICMLYIIGLPCLISWYFLIFWNESFRSFYSLNWP